MLSPPLILLAGLVTVVGLILVLRFNAFLALITAAMLVSLLAPGPWTDKIERVAEAFGSSAGKIGIAIALAAVIGKCLMDSGAADRIVRAFLGVLGERRASAALLASGFVLAVPVFFDTVFYLLVPLARSLWRRTRKNYVLYLLAIVTGTAITHVLVPPTPGPLLMAGILGVDLGTMILIGLLVAVPTAFVGLLACHFLNRRVPVECRPLAGESEADPLDDSELPSLGVSILPILLPVVLISAGTLIKTFRPESPAAAPAEMLGNVNLALLLAATVSMVVLVRRQGLTLARLARTTETALASGGLIILITAAGGAFGAMLQTAGVGDTVRQYAGGGQQTSGILLLLLAGVTASVVKMAQGSSTVAMIATAGMFASSQTTPETLGFNPVYLALAISTGSLVGSWMNDSGFWIYSRMGGLTEWETLKTWSPILAIIGIFAFSFTLLLAWLMPLVPVG